MQKDTGFDPTPTTDDLDSPSISVLAIDRQGDGRFMPISSAMVLTRKGLATLKGDGSSTLLLFLDD